MLVLMVDSFPQLAQVSKRHFLGLIRLSLILALKKANSPLFEIASVLVRLHRTSDVYHFAHSAPQIHFLFSAFHRSMDDVSRMLPTQR